MKAENRSNQPFGTQYRDTQVSQTDMSSVCEQLVIQAARKLFVAATSTHAHGDGKSDADASLGGSFDHETAGLYETHRQEATTLLTEFIKPRIGKRSVKAQSDSNRNPEIIELHDKLSLDYERDTMLTIGALEGLGKEEMHDYLKGILMGEPTVSQDGENFRWFCEEKYAPRRIEFEVSKKMPLTYRKNGDLADILTIMDAQPIASILDPVFTRGSDHITFCLGSAQVKSGESGSDSAIFTIAFEAAEAADMLLAVHWGGSTNKTSKADAQLIKTLENVQYFESVSSQRGGEGYDFFIISLDSDPKLRDTAQKLLVNTRLDECDDMDVFAQKYKLSCQYRSSYNNYAQRYGDLKKKMSESLRCIQENECLKQNYFVAVPDFFLDIPEMIEDDFDFNQDIDELQNRYMELELTTFEALQADIEEKLEAWEEFAPKYAMLYDPVVKTCHGRLLVKGSKAVIFIVGRDEVEKDFRQSKCKKYEYAFNEIEFGYCLSMVSNCIAKEQAAKTKNQELLNKLLAE